jgi:hypothetical protein
MKVRIASVTCRTEVNEARRMAWRVMMEKNDQVHPGGVGRGEVQHDPRVLRQPGLDVGVVVGRVVVDHDVQFAARIRLGNQFQELEELDAAVARVAGIGDLAGRDLKGSEQRGGAVSGGSRGTASRPARP